MNRTTILLGATAVATFLLSTAVAQAAAITTTQITPTTALPFFTYGSQQFLIGQINDGITADSPFNGFASNGISAGRITFALDQAYDLDSFTLWNDINVVNEGVRSFKLTFEDIGGNLLSSSATLTAVSQFAPQVYSFASVAGVKTVQLDVLTSSLQIEIREVAFNGVPTVSAVPEPVTYALMLAGLGLVGFMARHRKSA